MFIAPPLQVCFTLVGIFLARHALLIRLYAVNIGLNKVEPLLESGT